MIHVEILPPPQRAFWDDEAPHLPGGWPTINEGVAALLALYGDRASGLQSVKTIAWFKDGGLDTLLPAAVKERLVLAAAQYDPHTPAAPKLSRRLD